MSVTQLFLAGLCLSGLGVTGYRLQGLAAHGPISIPALISCLSLFTVNAWELGEGYNVAENMPGRGGVLTGVGGVAGQEPHL